MACAPRLPDAVIFDFDGVLVDSEPYHYRAFQEVLAPLGLGHSYATYVNRYIGYDDRDAFREIFRDAGRDLDPPTLRALIAGKQKAFQTIVSAGVKAFPGVHPLIRSLLGEKIPLAIASGSTRQEIASMLNALGLHDAFPVIVTADDVERSKPDPQSYLLAVCRLRSHNRRPDLRPEACAVIEDTPAGIRAARDAGLSVIAVGHSYPVETLREAHLTVPALADIDFRALELALERRTGRRRLEGPRSTR